MVKSKLVEAHIKCPMCGSSDAYSLYDDGHGFCFSCNKPYYPNKEELLADTENEVEGGTYDFYAHRGISRSTFEYYGVYTQFVEDQPIKLGFKYANNAIKFRSLSEKKFWAQGPMSEASLFGMDKFDPGSKDSITITEGEYDALSAYEILGGRSAVVSVRSSSSAKADATRAYDYINSFKRIVLCLDSDEPGQAAARSIASLFDYSKVYRVILSRHKDANEYLVAGDADDFYKAWDAAKRYAPDNIINSRKEFAESLKQTKEDLLCTYPFGQLQNRLYGFHRGEVIVFKGPEGIGKTEIFRAIEHHILATTKLKIGLLHLEEDNGTTVKALAGYILQQPTVLPDCNVSNDDILAAIDRVNPKDDRIFIHSSFDVEDENGILDNIRYLVSAGGCDFIFLDHISWLATGGDDDDERKKLDRISQKLKLLAKELRFCLIMISHVNDNGQTRGSRNITKVANTVIDMQRDTDAGSLETHLLVQKARLGGNTGPAGVVIFDKTTYTLRDTNKADEIIIPHLT